MSSHTVLYNPEGQFDMHVGLIFQEEMVKKDIHLVICLVFIWNICLLCLLVV